MEIQNGVTFDDILAETYSLKRELFQNNHVVVWQRKSMHYTNQCKHTKLKDEVEIYIYNFCIYLLYAHIFDFSQFICSFLIPNYYP